MSGSKAAKPSRTGVFRRLTAHSAAPTRTIELFISPDQRFVTEALQDTWVDSTVERERAARVAEAALLADASPSKALRAR